MCALYNPNMENNQNDAYVPSDSVNNLDNHDDDDIDLDEVDDCMTPVASDFGVRRSADCSCLKEIFHIIASFVRCRLKLYSTHQLPLRPLT